MELNNGEYNVGAGDDDGGGDGDGNGNDVKVWTVKRWSYRSGGNR